MSFIKNQVLGDESPLYGRRTGLETGPFAKYIKVLTELRIVKKRNCDHRETVEKTICLPGIILRKLKKRLQS